MTLLQQDKQRKGSLPFFQIFMRLCQQTSKRNPLHWIYRAAYRIVRFAYHADIPYNTQIGGGVYIGHPYCIVINGKAVIGKNVNIHKGVTIGQENRGKRKGAPTIGDCVYIGINSTIVGNVTIGNDVLIAPNTYVNRDIPSHSIVLGNPCIIKPRENATEGYVNNRVLD